MRTLNFEQMEVVNGGSANACGWTMTVVAIGIGGLGLMATGGAAIVLFAYGSWISVLGAAVC